MAAEILSPQVGKYLERIVPERHEVLVEMEAYAAQKDFPIIGPVCGHFCYQVTRMIGARRVFELGSGFGYSTAWFARAVQENGGGMVHHVVWDQQLSDMAQAYLSDLGLRDFVSFRVSEAVHALRETSGGFDLIFNDIDKNGYPDSLPVIKEKLRPGGVMIADNAIWSGRIFDQEDDSAETDGVRRFNELIAHDPDWIVSIVPLRDGLLVAAKREERI
jgi:caffeoyl-CoA O-methyltransferase